MPKLTPKQVAFTKHIIAGNNLSQAARLAGYSPDSAGNTGSMLIRNSKIREILAKAGLDEQSLSAMLNTSIRSGLGIKSTNADAMRGIELSYKLLGYIKDSNDSTSTDNSINVYIKELHTMSSEELSQKIKAVEAELVTNNP